jgi:hypothetical protein
LRNEKGQFASLLLEPEPKAERRMDANFHKFPLASATTERGSRWPTRIKIWKTKGKMSQTRMAKNPDQDPQK